MPIVIGSVLLDVSPANPLITFGDGYRVARSRPLVSWEAITLVGSHELSMMVVRSAGSTPGGLTVRRPPRGGSRRHRRQTSEAVIPPSRM